MTLMSGQESFAKTWPQLSGSSTQPAFSVVPTKLGDIRQIRPINWALGVLGILVLAWYVHRHHRGRKR